MITLGQANLVLLGFSLSFSRTLFQTVVVPGNGISVSLTSIPIQIGSFDTFSVLYEECHANLAS